MNDSNRDLPTYHLDELFPDQLAVIERLGNPAIIGSHETSIFLSDPEKGICPPHYHGGESSTLAGIGPAHAVTYVCPVIMVLDRPKMVMPNGDLNAVDPAGIQPPLAHWISCG